MQKYTGLFIFSFLFVVLVSCKQTTTNTKETVISLNEMDLASFGFNINLTDSANQEKFDEYITKQIEIVLNKLLPYLREKRSLVNGNIADIYFACDSINKRFYLKGASIYRIQTSNPEDDEDLKLAALSSNTLNDSQPQCMSRQIRENFTDIHSLANIIKKGCKNNENGLANITVLYSYR